MDYLQLSERVRLVQNTLNIYEIVSRHVILRKDGELYVGKCPFHDDDGESLAVNTGEGKFYCYGCHAGGNALNFMARVNNTDLMAAFEFQAKKLGFEINPTTIDFDAEKIERVNRELTEINDYARDFYHEILMTADEGDTCRKYLESRGITKREIEKFQLGFATNHVNDLAEFLDWYDFKFYAMLQSGLVESTDEGFKDKFNECITIPVQNRFGKTAVLIGRVLDFEKKIFYESEGVVNEYVYPKENSVFNRSQLIFGMNFARNEIVKSNSVIVVESCLDAISLMSAGVENVVAVFDKTLTAAQADNLVTFAKRIIFCLKNGDALNFDEEVLTSISRQEGKLFVAALSESPCEFVNTNGTETFYKTLENALPVRDYEFSKITYVATTALSRTAAQFSPVSTVESVAVRKAGASILKVACREIGLFKYVMAILPPEIFSKSQQKAIEYLQLCASENSRPDKEGAAIFFDGNVDEEFLAMLEDTKDLTAIDRKAFEDGLDFLSRKVWSQKYSAEKRRAMDENSLSDKVLKNLLEMTKQK